MPERRAARGSVTYRQIVSGKPVFDFDGDVAPRWFRYSNAGFTVDVTGVESRLMLRGREIAPGTVFNLGDL